MFITFCISDLINIELIELLGVFEFRTEEKLKVTDNETALQMGYLEEDSASA